MGADRKAGRSIIFHTSNVSAGPVSVGGRLAGTSETEAGVCWPYKSSQDYKLSPWKGRVHLEEAITPGMREKETTHDEWVKRREEK